LFTDLPKDYQEELIKRFALDMGYDYPEIKDRLQSMLVEVPIKFTIGDTSIQSTINEP
jgi:hypothetical protein